MSNVIIHIGIRKSATTWFQEKLFPKLSNIHFVGKRNYYYPQWLKDIHYLDDFAFDRNIEEVISAAKLDLKEGILNVISSEAFTNTSVIFSQACRIKAVFPSAKILITLRDPIDTILSHYKLDVADGIYHLPLEEYLDWSRTPFDLVKRKPIYLPDFFYDEMINLYERLFKEQNVCVLRYEDMLENPKHFFSELDAFMGGDSLKIYNSLLYKKENVSKSNDEIQMARAKNFIQFLKTHYPGVIQKIQKNDIQNKIDIELMPERLEQLLRDYFKDRAYGYY